MEFSECMILWDLKSHNLKCIASYLCRRAIRGKRPKSFASICKRLSSYHYYHHRYWGFCRLRTTRQFPITLTEIEIEWTNRETTESAKNTRWLRHTTKLQVCEILQYFLLLLLFISHSPRANTVTNSKQSWFVPNQNWKTVRTLICSVNCLLLLFLLLLCEILCEWKISRITRIPYIYSHFTKYQEYLCECQHVMC